MSGVAVLHERSYEMTGFKVLAAAVTIALLAQDASAFGCKKGRFFKSKGNSCQNVPQETQVQQTPCLPCGQAQAVQPAFRAAVAAPVRRVFGGGGCVNGTCSK